MKLLVVLCSFLVMMSLASAISVDDFSLADLGFNGFVVEANLDTQGSAQVLYGKTGALGSASNTASASSEHLLQVDGLTSNTVYFYRVVGKDAQGNSYSSAISLTRTPPSQVATTPPTSNANANLLFASGFEANTKVNGKGELGAWQDYQYITGTDKTTGFTWRSNLIPEWKDSNSGIHTIHGNSKPQDTIENVLVTINDRNGNPTTALRQTKLSTPGAVYGGPGSQTPFQINNILNDPSESYYTWWHRYDDLSTIKDSNDWRMLWQYKTNRWDNAAKDGYRISIFIGTDGTKNFWRTVGDTGTPQSTYTKWSDINNNVPVKTNEWFKVEVYTKWSAGSDGIFWAKIDGQEIAYNKGPNIGPPPDNLKWSSFWQFYGPGFGQQWIDDVQIWDGYPGDGESITNNLPIITPPISNTPPATNSPTNPNAELLFKSGFEGTSDVCRYASSENPRCTTAYQCGAENTLKGEDSGYDWQQDVPGLVSKMFFNDVIGGSPDCCANGCKATSLNQCHILDVVNVAGPDGTPTNALYYKRIKDCSTHSYSRLQLNFPADHASSNEYDDFNPIYFRYWIRFQDNLYDTLTAKNWRQIWEFYYQGNDWSNEFMLVNINGVPKWQLKGRFYGTDLTTQWIQHSTKNVPKDGEWFLLESYVKSGRSDGEIVVRINGDTIFDVAGPQFPTNRRVGQEPQTAAMLKLYTSAQNQEQWMDDLEIWSDDPYK